VTDIWESQRELLGAFIKEQRKKANLSLRQLAELTSLSNPYLSQVERGLHQPSVRVLRAISDALNLSAESMLTQAGLIDAIASVGTTQDGTAQDGTAQDGTAQDGTAQDGTALDGTGLKAALPTEDAIRADKRLSDDQKSALIAVYRSMLG
jgi:transcriptional regulator with XRE-family HTH domain